MTMSTGTRTSRAIVLAFAAVLAGVWLIPGVAVDENRAITDFPVLSSAGLASAEYFRTIDAALVDRLPLKGDVVSAVGATLVADNVSTSSQVFVGPSGETFLTDEFVVACTLRPVIPGTDARIRDLRDAFAARGIDFVYAIAPDKTSIERDAIGPLADPLMRCADATRDDLQAMADEPDSPMFVAWSELEALPGRRYIEGDTHWTGKTAAVFAGLLLDRLGADGVARPGIFERGDLHPQAVIDYVGGLYTLVGVDRSTPVTLFTTKREGVDVEYEAEVHDGAITDRWISTGPDLIEGRTLVLHDSFYDMADAVLAPYFADITALPLTSMTTPGTLATLDGYDHVIVVQVQRTVPVFLREIEAAEWITAGR